MTPQARSEVLCEYGATDRLHEIVEEDAPDRVFLVTGDQSYSTCGAEAALTRALAPCLVERFSHSGENDFDVVGEGIGRARAFVPDLFVAVGGGSVIDLAKSINILAAQTNSPMDYVSGRRSLGTRGRKLIALPTTAGSGSEVTHFAKVRIGRMQRALAHSGMRPDVALLEPGFLKTVPRQVAASGGLGALNQAIESYWSVHATRESQGHAREAIECLYEHLPRLIHAPDQEAALEVARGANLSGRAIDQTRATAAHALAGPITSHFGVAQGHAIGLLMPALLRFNASVTEDDCLHPMGARHVQSTLLEISTLLGSGDADDAATRYEALIDELGLSRDLRKSGLERPDALETVIDDGFDPKRVSTNPRRLTERALQQMLEALL